MKYQHLSQDNRITIAEENRRGASVAAIARMAGCHRTAISREVKRNSISDKHYEGDYAHRRADRRRTKASALARKLREKSADEVLRASKKMMSGYAVNTITSGRGSEFARYKGAEAHFNADWYVCASRCPHQRGIVEWLSPGCAVGFPKPCLRLM